MEQIKNYIDQARLQGQNDDQIKQDLITAGWQLELVDAAFAAAVVPRAATVTPLISKPATLPVTSRPVTSPGQLLPSKKSTKQPLVLIAAVILILVIVGLTFTLLLKKTSYQSVALQFITAMRDKDKTKVDSLESPAFAAYIKKNTSGTTGLSIPSTTSFYAVCQAEGTFCTTYFQPSFMNKASLSYKNYTATNKTKGEEMAYTKKEAEGSVSCPSNAVATVYIDIYLVPHGNSWLINNISAGSNSSGTVNLCAQGGNTVTNNE